VHLSAPVIFWRFGQSLRRFKREVFRQLGAHDAENITALTALSSRTK
jgi:hypothetical protein